MPVLLLCRGDKEGKELLRKAIKARYGLGAPAFEAIAVALKGRKRVKIGPMHTWLPMEATLSLQFPFVARWDFNLKGVGLKVNAGSRAFDGSRYRVRARGSAETPPQEVLVRSARLRLWATAALLLTPLGEANIEINAAGERAFTARHLETGDQLIVSLRENFSVERITTRISNPEAGSKEQTFTLFVHEGNQEISGLILPAQVSAMWDDIPEYELSPCAVDLQPTFGEGFFELR